MLDEALRWLGFGLCHQLPERSIIALGHQLPVCARDTGIYVGFAVSLIVIGLLERGRRSSEMPRAWLLGLGAVFVGVMAIDGVTSYAGLRETTNALRLLSGLLAGYGLTLVLVPILNGQLWRVSARTRLLDGGRRVVWWLGSIPVLFALGMWVLPYAGIAFSLLTGAAIVVTFTATNLAIVCLAPPMERKADRLRDAWAAVLIAGVVTALELMATSGIRIWLERLAGIR
jgi:uncharacterized membrane protein